MVVARSIRQSTKGRFRDAELQQDDGLEPDSDSEASRNRNTIEFLGIWEQSNNPHFNPVEFNGFRKQAGLNSFTLTLIKQRLTQPDRLRKLNSVAIDQMKLLVGDVDIKRLKRDR
jgi:hypothetical protein